VPGTYPTIQAALDAAQDGDTVLVQPGTYNESLVFPNAAVTLESAGGSAVTTIDATGLQARVILIVASPSVTVRGFTITGGNVQDVGYGGGVYTSAVATTIQDCRIIDNVLTGNGFAQGGGIYAATPTQLVGCEIRDNHVVGIDGLGGGGAGAVTATGCLLADNSAYRGGGAAGGIWSHCTFEGNVAVGDGGGFYSFLGGGPIDCLFKANVSGGSGGGCAINSVGGLLAVVQLQGCTFLGNVAGGAGGGAALSASADMGGATVSVVNCIFAGNEAVYGDGFVGSTLGVGGFGGTCVSCCTLDGDALLAENTVLVEHVIARNPSAGGPFQLPFGGTLTVSWSDVQGGWVGLGNFDSDPLFVNPAAGDYHLSVGSPCIDAGDPAYSPTSPGFGCYEPGDDVDGQPRPLGGHVDIGADESEPDCNQNGLGDLSEILAGTATDCDGDLVLDECQPFADCNGNGQFDACDIAQGLAVDCNGNWIPDDCEPFRDCNGNGQLDECDIASGASTDCDHDGVPDECQAFVDCNANGQFDACDIQSGTSHDCNGNGMPDECDIASGASLDADANGWPDECESVLHVPADHATIQAAIDAAEDGDAVVLADGTYSGPGNVELDFHGKELLVEGTPGACLIECNGERFAHLGGPEAGGVQLRGLKILHGQANNGGAVLCEDGAVLDARDCTFEHNAATLGGGGVLVRNGASATFRRCAFLGNQGQNGGGLRVSAATALVEHATFSNNSAVGKGGGIGAVQAGVVTVRDSIFQLDTAGNGPELQADGEGSLIDIMYSDVVGGFLATNATNGAHFIWGAGMIESDPLLAGVPLDLHLLPGSPCINTADPAGPPDADGSPPDMGAVPYVPWALLGGGIAGTFGFAQLDVNGPLTPNSAVQWMLGQGPAGAPFSLVVGFAQAGLATHGGVLWPEPQVLLALGFGDQGVAQGKGRWPSGIPSGTGLWLQAWFADGGAAGGIAASNGVHGTAP
jgi:hypothetical protein